MVELETSTESWAGTDDHLYAGVFGTEGGREFNLNVSGFNDYEPGSKVGQLEKLATSSVATFLRNTWQNSVEYADSLLGQRNVSNAAAADN